MSALLLLLVLMLPRDQVEWLRADWTRGPEHLLGIHQWDGQQRAVRALQQHRRVAVKSGHKVGKTHLVGSLVCSLLPIYPHARIITSASTAKQLSENVWGEIRSQRRNARIPLGGTMPPRANEWRMEEFSDLWYAVGISTNEPESFQGKHSEDGIVVVILDECQSIDREIVTAAKTMTSDANGYLLAIANPTIPSGWFHEACTVDSTWHVVTLSCYSHPNIVQGRKVMPGPTMDLIRTFEGTPEEGPRLRGEFNEQGGDRLITLASLRTCMEVEEERLESDGVHIGADIADQGGDRNVACVTEGRRVIDVQEWVSHGEDGLIQTADRLMALADRVGCPPGNLHVDKVGVGAGVVAYMRRQGFGVDGVGFGDGPKGDWSALHGDYIEFLNRRAELYWTARVLIEQRQFEIPARFRTLHADLAAPGFEFVSDRKVKIEAKEKIRKRIDRSPDHGDAFVLSLSRVGRLLPRMRSLA